MNTERFKTSVTNAIIDLGLGTPESLITPLQLALFADYIEENRNAVPTSMGMLSIVERFGGPEVGTEDYHIVYKVNSDEETYYFRMDGRYDIETDGVDWDNALLREVQRVERVVYMYE